MLLFVVDIRHDGLVLARPGSDVGRYWLPASDCSDGPSSWEEVRRAAVPGMPIGVSEVPGRYVPGGLQVVSTQGPAACDLDLAWKGEIHALRIDGMSKTLIRGHIGALEVVMKREEYAAFLNAFPRSELIHDHGALALGDWICGVFVAERGQGGRVQISFTDAVARIRTECEEEVRSSHGRDNTELVEIREDLTSPPTPLFYTAAESLTPVLFVENDDLCRQMWTDILMDAGVEVDAFDTYARAAKAIENPARKYKMAIVDIHLTGAYDHLGLALARTLTDRPGCRVILTSAEDGSARKREAWGELRVHGYIAKPALLDDWAAAIDAAVAAPWPTPLRDLLSESSERISTTGGPTPDSTLAASASVDSVLNAFCQEAPGVVAHVFRLHPRSWRGRSLANAGGRLNWEPYRGKLGKSTIRDTAESDHSIVYNSAENEWPHRWTKAMLDYESFWGQRLFVAGSQYRHVLVAFHPARNFFSSDIQLRARCCAERVASILTREALERHQGYESEQSSAGLGFACLAHEIFSALNGVDMAVKRIDALLSAADGALSDSAPQLHAVVARLRQRVPDLVENARILRGAAGGDKPVSVLFCIEKAVMGITEAKGQILKRPQNVAVAVEPSDGERRWLVRANAGALVTVFFNVLLNAVQQIEIFSAIRPTGWVRAAAKYYEDAQGLPWALVFIRDSGPGIHPDDWERVFDAGYTTKEKGTGLGLHICRQLLRRIRVGNREASIRIARSTLWAGTTVAIELPLSVVTEDGELSNHA